VAHSVTEQWAVIAVQGPRARDVLEPLVTGIDLSRSALPHMAVAEGRVLGVPMLLFRVSFTGELGYEINVPAGFGPRVWERVHGAGRDAASRPTAPRRCTCCARRRVTSSSARTRTARRRRTTRPRLGDRRKKPDFVGKRSLERRP
jgi:sarcosine oxidase subunit alpha